MQCQKLVPGKNNDCNVDNSGHTVTRVHSPNPPFNKTILLKDSPFLTDAFQRIFKRPNNPLRQILGWAAATRGLATVDLRAVCPAFSEILRFRPFSPLFGSSQTWLFQTWLFATFTPKRSFAFFCALAFALFFCLPRDEDNFGVSQASLSFSKGPWTSQNFPELPRKFLGYFPETSLTADEIEQSRGSPEVSQTSPEVPEQVL